MNHEHKCPICFETWRHVERKCKNDGPETMNYQWECDRCWREVVRQRKLNKVYVRGV